MPKSRLNRRLCAISTAVLMCGCGGESASVSESTGSEKPSAAAATSASASDASRTASGISEGSPAARVTASIPGAAGDTPASEQVANATANATANDGAKPSEPPVDEVTRLLNEAQQLRIAAVPTDLEQARKSRRERNERIVELATNVLRLTMNDKTREPQFHLAIGQLLEARFQMALAGDQADIEQLYADVQLLNDHDPKSVAAAEGVYYIAKFAHTKAGLLGRTQPQWFETLSRWAREFADRFPEQNNRAVTLLFGAARSCELHSSAASDADLASRLMTEAKLCYSALAEKFPKSEQGQDAAAVLRRMALAGQKLSQFAGPTLDGGYVSVDEFPGKPTLIYFWESEDAEFAEKLLPLLQKIRSQATSDRLRIVGVAMDDDESELEAFMETHAVPGQQIFFPNAEQRSWKSPLIRFWGISKCPSLWLVDDKGTVVSTSVTSAGLIPALQKLIK